jgi:hypothetical protein
MAKSTVYLDDTGHVQELSLPVAGGQWTEANATQEAGAEPAMPGSPLAGYGWTGGHSGQAAYLGQDGNLWELSRPVSGQWAGVNLTGTATPAPPQPAAGSELTGCEWGTSASGAPPGKHASFLDCAGQVWDVNIAVGGQWTAVNVTAAAQGIEKAPPAAPGSALSTYQFLNLPGSNVEVQVVYLDTAGHLHEMGSFPNADGLTRWGHLDMTLQAGAPTAVAGSPLSGYGWPNGYYLKQVVYLDDAGHVWELLNNTVGPWSAADLTQLSGAPPAAAGSPLSGFVWTAGQAGAGTKQVVFLDDAGHVHELSFITVLPGLGQPRWTDIDITAQAGAKSARAGSPLSGCDWPAARSKQVSYIDVDGQVTELSAAPGTPWSVAGLTQLTGAPAPAAGSPAAGYKTLTDLTTLYGLLRAQVLSRHFALGRYFRADHLSFRNLLGTVHQAGKQAVYLDAARHVRQLFLGADGKWADGGDLTAATGAPAVAAGSRLAGCQWPRGPQFAAYLDAAGHVHSMGAGANTGGFWGDLDLHQEANPPAVPAAGSALTVYPWAGGDADQIAYLDDDGHVHELSAPVGGYWSDADLTQLCGAEPAGPGAQPAGYDWQAGGAKQVAYLDDAGHVWELSFPVGGSWTATDVTATITPAPARAKPTSPLAGYGWPAGQSKHVAYLDSFGRAWELSCPVGGSWTATNVTAAATPVPRPAAPYSPLAAYAGAVGNSDPGLGDSDWAAANSRQVLYFDADGHVWELSAAPGGSWTATDIIASTRAPVAAPGSPLSGYAWAGGMAKQVVYLDRQGHVRELSVPAFGDWLHQGVERDLTAATGAVPATLTAHSPLSGYEYPGPAENILAHDFLWDPNGATLVQPATVYPSAAALSVLPAGQRLFERWRVGDRARANPLMYSGQLMTCLAVENALGLAGGGKEILTRLLATTKSLFKFQTPPYDGYILRWDTVTSDHWSTGLFEGGVATFGCADFLTDSDRPGGWLYCTPLDDPRYVPYMPQSDFNKLSTTAKNVYQNNRRLSLDRIRFWEPSTDELTGLIAGYSFIATVTTDPDIRAQVTDQVTRLAGYLSANGYLLVRPEGGFTAQGSAGMAPAMEFPFGRVFQRITGDAHPAQVSFEGALANALLWSRFSTPFGLLGAAGPVTGAVALGLLTTFVPGLAQLIGVMIAQVGGIGSLLSLIGGGGFTKAWYLNNAHEVFDVYAYPGGGPNVPAPDNGLQQEFCVAYLLCQFGAVPRFNVALAGLSEGIGGYAQNFPPFLGLSAVGDTDRTVADAFLGWLPARRNAGDSHLAALDAFASAVAVNLGSGQAEQQNLVSLLWQKAAYFDDNGDDLDLLDNALVYDGHITYVTEEVGSALNFLSALALAWRFAKAQADAGTPLPASLGFPAPPTTGTPLPTAMLPGAVAAATIGPDPEQVLGLPTLSDPVPADTDLFADTAPHKPPDAPPLTEPVHWVYVYTSAMDHSGNLFGDSGTDTINSGKALTGAGCVILGVKLELVQPNGAPLGDEGTSMTPPAAAAVTGGFPSTVGAAIVPGVTYPSTDEAITVRWWYNTGRACRYRIGYLVQGVNCAL